MTEEDIKKEVSCTLENFNSFLFGTVEKKCSCCNKIKPINKFFGMRHRYFLKNFLISIPGDYCRDCVLKEVKFDWKKAIKYCEYYNIPFIVYEWDDLVQRCQQRGNIKSCFGKYYAKMRLKGFSNVTFIDSFYINQQYYYHFNENEDKEKKERYKEVIDYLLRKYITPFIINDVED